MSSPQSLLIVDDDADIRELLGQFLNQHSFEIALASDGASMFAQLEQQSFDMIILDLMMPGEDGLTLCKKIRHDSDIPIIMLTAVGDEIDRIIGLEMGADDYLPKPFNPRELLARIKAILRRRSHDGSNFSEEKIISSQLSYQFNGWRLVLTTRQLFSPDHTEISLSGGEFDLLVAFAEHPQRVLNRDQLLDFTKNRQAGLFDRSIDIQISRLRRKIEDDPKHPVIIKTVRGGGYVFSCGVSKLEGKEA